METFPLNNWAEKFEVDRSTMVRALKFARDERLSRLDTTC
jgi:hypothetical protein